MTNASNWNYLEEIINTIPNNYTIHLIGHINKQSPILNRKNVIYDGFVDIYNYFLSHNFCFVFARGGFAAMDIIDRNIPLFLIYDRGEKSYLEALTTENFLKLSDNNFVTRTEFDKKIFLKELENLKNNRNKFLCKNLLKKYNNLSRIKDPYKGI